MRIKYFISEVPIILPLLWCLGSLKLSDGISVAIIIAFALLVFFLPPASLIVELVIWVVSGYFAFTTFTGWALSLWFGLLFLRLYLLKFFTLPSSSPLERPKHDLWLWVTGIACVIALSLSFLLYCLSLNAGK